MRRIPDLRKLIFSCVVLVAACGGTQDDVSVASLPLAEATNTSADEEPASTKPPDTDPLNTEVAETATTTDPPTTITIPTTTTTPLAPPDPLTFVGIDPTVFEPGIPGEVSIVSVLDPAGRDSGLVVLRNNTDDTIFGLEVTATGRDPSGTLVATGQSQGSVEPAVLHAGQLAVAYVYTGTDEVPAGTTFEYQVGDIQTDGTYAGSLPVKITEGAFSPDDIVPEMIGVTQNVLDETVIGPISVLILCFGAANEIVGYANGYTDLDELQPGATSTFSAYVERSDTCERWIGGASGYNF
jgi:hypothetical protein